MQTQYHAAKPGNMSRGKHGVNHWGQTPVLQAARRQPHQETIRAWSHQPQQLSLQHLGKRFDSRRLPSVELELGSKESAIEVYLSLEGERVRSHPLGLHLWLLVRKEREAEGGVRASE